MLGVFLYNIYITLFTLSNDTNVHEKLQNNSNFSECLHSSVSKWHQKEIVLSS